LNKTDLINTVADKTGMKKVQVSTIVNAAFDAIKDALKNDEKVGIPGFGTFVVVERAAREGRNPKTGEPIKIAAKKVVRFRVGKDLREIGK